MNGVRDEMDPLLARIKEAVSLFEKETGRVVRSVAVFSFNSGVHRMRVDLDPEPGSNFGWSEFLETLPKQEP